MQILRLDTIRQVCYDSDGFSTNQRHCCRTSQPGAAGSQVSCASFRLYYLFEAGAKEAGILYLMSFAKGVNGARW